MIKLYILMLLAGLQIPLRAVILYRTGAPLANTTIPGDSRDAAWDLQGTWGNFLGTPISPNHFITAAHVGGSIGQTFTYNGTPYTTVDFDTSPTTDLRIWEVSGTFSSFAELYTKTDEIGKEMFVVGRGTQRGSTINVPGASVSNLRGWGLGTADNVMRWGENTVEGFGNSGTLLYGGFDRTSSLTEEAHLSVGDSGGAMFIQDSGTWKLAGIHFAVTGPFKHQLSDPSGFNAALFDMGGLYVNTISGYAFVTDNAADVESGFFSTRISTEQAWIGTVIPELPPWVLMMGCMALVLTLKKVRSPPVHGFKMIP